MGQSATVKKVGEELMAANAVRIALKEHADDAEAIMSAIESETNLPEALCAVYEDIADDEALLPGLQQRIKELGERAARIEQTCQTRRNIILMAMEKAGLTTIKGPLATLYKRDTPAKVIVNDEALIPAKFWKAGDPRLDRKALKEALDAKEEIPGATLSNGGLTLGVRIK